MSLFMALSNISFASEVNSFPPDCCKKKAACCKDKSACCTADKTQKSDCCKEGADCCKNNDGCCSNNGEAKNNSSCHSSAKSDKHCDQHKKSCCK